MGWGKKCSFVVVTPTACVNGEHSWTSVTCCSGRTAFRLLHVPHVIVCCTVPNDLTHIYIYIYIYLFIYLVIWLYIYICMYSVGWQCLWCMFDEVKNAGNMFKYSEVDGISCRLEKTMKNCHTWRTCILCRRCGNQNDLLTYSNVRFFKNLQVSILTSKRCPYKLHMACRFEHWKDEVIEYNKDGSKKKSDPYWSIPFVSWLNSVVPNTFVGRIPNRMHSSTIFWWFNPKPKISTLW